MVLVTALTLRFVLFYSAQLSDRFLASFKFRLYHLLQVAYLQMLSYLVRYMTHHLTGGARLLEFTAIIPPLITANMLRDLVSENLLENLRRFVLIIVLIVVFLLATVQEITMAIVLLFSIQEICALIPI